MDGPRGLPVTGGERDGDKQVCDGVRPRRHGRQHLELHGQPTHAGKLSARAHRVLLEK